MNGIVKAERAETVSVFPDAVLQLHTTRSWDFLEGESSMRRASPRYKHLSSDVIIGMIDTGNFHLPFSFSFFFFFFF
jgi:hypothetical protein